MTVLKAAAMMMALVLAYLALWLVATFVLPWVFVALAMPPMMMVALMGAASGRRCRPSCWRWVNSRYTSRHDTRPRGIRCRGWRPENGRRDRGAEPAPKLRSGPRDLRRGSSKPDGRQMQAEFERQESGRRVRRAGKRK